MPVPKRRLLAIALITAVVFALFLPRLLPRPAPHYTVTDLGVLPGDTISWATGINNRGEIVGFSATNYFDAGHIFCWINGRMTNLGPLDSPNIFHKPCIDDSGKINRKQSVSNELGVMSFGRTIPKRAVLYSDGKQIIVSTPPGCVRAMLCGINTSGQVVGRCRRLTARSSLSKEAFVYDTNTRKIVFLALPPGFSEAEAEAINDHNQITGWARQPGQSGLRAVLWNAGLPAAVPLLPGKDNSSGAAINNQGEVVGSAWSEPNAAAQYVNDHPLRWRLLVPIFERQWKNRAMIYRSGKAQDLNTLIPEDADWTLEEAHGINDHGQIVGYGLHHGQERAFLLTPTR